MYFVRLTQNLSQPSSFFKGDAQPYSHCLLEARLLVERRMAAMEIVQINQQLIVDFYMHQKFSASNFVVIMSS